MIPPPWIQRLLRAPAPRELPIVAGSTPILCFGDATKAKIATLGLNPSRREFHGRDGRPLPESARRLETLVSLGLTAPSVDLSLASGEQVTRAWSGMTGYFRRNPYWEWFGPLEELLEDSGESFAGGGACHLDLAPWATDPTWGGLHRRDRAQLSSEGAPILHGILENGSATALLINGRGVWRAFEASLGIRLAEIEPIDRTTPPGCSLGAGVGPGGVRLLAWSVNLQSSWGVTRAFRSRLAQRVTTWWSSLAG